MTIRIQTYPVDVLLYPTNYTNVTWNITHNISSVSPRYLTATVIAFNKTTGPSINVTSEIQLRLARPAGDTTIPALNYFCSNETYTVNGTNVTITTTFDLDTLLNHVNLSPFLVPSTLPMTP